MQLEVHPKMKYGYRLFVLKEFPKNAICAEIGVYEGTFSQKILEICEPKMLHLIDPQPQEKFYHNEQFFEGNYRLHKFFFEETRFSNNYFDWVYLDADHGFLTTYNQLKLCYKKIKKGGYIAGDDYADYFIEVILAVNMFLRQYKDRVKLIYAQDTKSHQFKIRKIR